MASPSSSLATLRPDLADSVQEFDLGMNLNNFIAQRVFPVFNVAKKSGSYGVIPIEQLLQERDTLRAPGAKYSRGSFTFEPASYACLEHGAEEPIDDEEAEMYVEYFDMEAVSAARAQSAVMVNYEKRVAAATFNTATFSPTTITHEWDDETNAVPIKDVHDAQIRMLEDVGIWANALVINQKVFKNLRRTDEIIAAITSSGAGDPGKQRDISVQQIAQAFDLDFVIVGGGIRNSAIQGQDASPEQIWSDEYAWIGKVAVTGDIREPCVGRTFHYAGTGSQMGGVFEVYRDETIRGDVVRNRQDTDEKLIYAAGQLLDNITT